MSGSVPCRTCGQPVPPGRLACPACGTLVASLSSPLADLAPAIDPAEDAGGRAEAEPEPDPAPAPEAGPELEPAPWLRPRTAPSGAAVDPEPEPVLDPAAATDADVAPEPGAADEPEAASEPEAPEAAAEPEAAWEPEAAAASDEPAAPEAEAAPAPEPETAVAAEPNWEPGLSSEPEPDAEATSDAETPLGTSDDPDAAPAWPTAAAPLEAWAPRTAPPPAPHAPPQFRAEDETVTAAAAIDGLGSGGIVPGAYLPPSSVHRPAPPAADGPPAATDGWPAPGISTRPATPPPVQGASWIPPTPASYNATPGAAVPPPAAAASKPLVPGRSSILADLPFDAPDELEGWLVALGSAIAILGFFLPWTASLGTGFEGYFGSWGLGIVSHLPVFIFLVLVTGLAILPNRVATWVRTGVCGMVGGGILFGITWLYLGSDASQLGALLAAVGAVLLIVGGIIAVAPGRAAKRREGG